MRLTLGSRQEVADIHLDSLVARRRDAIGSRLNGPLAILLLAFVLNAACPPRPAVALDENEALALLVKTLDTNEDPAVRGALLKGMLRGLEGRRNVTAPKGWKDLSNRLASSGDANVRELSLQISQIFGDRSATAQALALLKDIEADVGRRRTALRSLLAQQNEEVSSLLESLLDEPELAMDAIRGYSNIENPSAAKILLTRFERLPPQLRRAVVETLASRKTYATQLVDALRRGDVPRDEIPAHVARSMSELLGDQFTDVFGDVRPVAADRAKQLAKYKKLLTPEAIRNADASRGRAVFVKTCAACHLLYGEGGKVGPDLTGSNRANLDYILLNSVDPSYDVPDAYKTVQILTVDGRVINGVLGEEDAARVILKTAEAPRVVIAKEDIESRSVSPKSMMPDGQLDQMKTQEVIDLIKYLRTTEQVEVAK